MTTHQPSGDWLRDTIVGNLVVAGVYIEVAAEVGLGTACVGHDSIVCPSGAIVRVCIVITACKEGDGCHVSSNQWCLWESWEPRRRVITRCGQVPSLRVVGGEQSEENLHWQASCISIGSYASYGKCIVGILLAADCRIDLDGCDQ